MSDGGVFVERLKQVPGTDALACLAAFDPSNELHVDATARLLLERFRQHDDVEAFTLLFELTHDRLAEIATRITRRLSPSVEPDDLAAAFMAKLFSDVRRRPREPVRHFLALAHTSMRNEVLDQLRQLRRARENAAHYQVSLARPADPADTAQREEHERILHRFGRAVIHLSGECFSTLEERDQQVLLAREIVRLPYDRVAGMLDLASDQVGMIIRRARIHLAERIVKRLPDATAPDGEAPDGAELDLLSGAVAACLHGKSGAKSVKRLMERMLDVSREAGRQKLADLLYEMTKACLVKAPDFSNKILIHAEPRRSDVVGDDLKQIATRLGHQDGPVDVDAVAARRPAPSTALDDARACLDKLADIEGASGRHQVAVALCHIHAGDPDQAEGVLRPLLETELPPITRLNAARNLTLALLRQERYAEARDLAEDGADEWPDDPARAMNLCYATARLGDREGFESSTNLLCAIQEQEPSPRVRAWIRGPLCELAREVGFDGPWLDELVAEVHPADTEENHPESSP